MIQITDSNIKPKKSNHKTWFVILLIVILIFGGLGYKYYNKYFMKELFTKTTKPSIAEEVTAFDEITTLGTTIEQLKSQLITQNNNTYSQLTILDNKLNSLTNNIATKLTNIQTIQQDKDVLYTLISINQLSSALQDSRPFTQQLATFKNINAKNKSLLALVTPLEKYQTTGIKSEDLISANFTLLINKLLIRSYKNDHTLKGYLKYYLSYIFIIRRIDSKDPNSTQTEDVIARTNEAFANRDLQRALDTLYILQDFNNPILNKLLEDLQARILANSITVSLQNEIINHLATGK